MQVVVEVQHVGRAVAKPGEGLAIRHVVVGAEAREVVAERVELVLVRLVEFTRCTQVLEAGQERSFGDSGEHGAGFLSRLQVRGDLRMHRHEPFAFVLGRTGGASAADVNHGESAVLLPEVLPPKLLHLADSEPRVAHEGKRCLLLADTFYDQQVHLL
ncbi:MAG: hypothetical protein QUV05_05660 [Phycisphaerae bacterium]|nr:hypothetical protein [Phycisphaerae bacterium]